MTIINNTYKFIYVHIPKAGGTSITSFFSKFSSYNDLEIGGTRLGERMQAEYFRRFGLSKHSPSRAIIKVVGEPLWSSYFTFTFVRNPYMRLYSVYKWLRRWDGWDGHGEFQSYLTFADFLDSEEYYGPGPAGIYRAQVFWVVHGGLANEPGVSYVGRIESVEKDIEYIRSQLSLPNTTEQLKVLNASDDIKVGIITDKMIERVKERYERDFVAFNYSMDVPTFNKNEGL